MAFAMVGGNVRWDIGSQKLMANGQNDSPCPSAHGLGEPNTAPSMHTVSVVLR